MSEPEKPFRWRTFCRRMIGAFIIVVIWAVRDTLKHDFVGVTTAVMTGIAVSVACYFWTRSDPNL
jgi:hypothetical protein